MLGIVNLLVIASLCSVATCVHSSQRHGAKSSGTQKNRAANDELLVQTSNGPVLGKQGTTVEANIPYYAFLGIPFAKPPIEDLRFANPVPAASWTEPLDATTEKSPCIQTGYTTNGSYGSEDCLYLNIYTTKKPGQNSALLPVMVWFYGGSFVDGSSLYSTNGPDYLLNDGVLYVSINYRVGVFGFLSTFDAVAPGNYGIKDQILALRWVKSNIAKFGGDPNSITLFGQDAGAASIAYLTQHTQLNGLFHKVIMQSGTSLDQYSLVRKPRDSAFTLGHEYGYFNSDSQGLISVLRNQTAESLRTTAKIAENLFYFLHFYFQTTIIFGPSLEPENVAGAVITAKSHKLLKEGHVIRVPHLMGFTSKEALYIYREIPQGQLELAQLFSDFRAYVPLGFNVAWYSQLFAAAEIRLHYAYIGGTIAFLSDNQYVRPIREHARLISGYTPTYLYELTYEGPLGKPVRILPGVEHYEDVRYLFRHATELAPSAKDLRVRHQLVRMWTNFAKAGNPTPGPDDLLNNVTWPKVASYDLIDYLDIGVSLVRKLNPHQSDMKFWDSIAKRYGQPDFDTY